MTTTTETKDKERGLASVPPEIEEEERAALALKDENVTRLAMVDPQAVEMRLQARERSLAAMRSVAIKNTHAYDWTLYKDHDGREVGVPRDSAAVQIRKWLGISIFNYRPVSSQGYPDPLVTKEPGEGGNPVTVIEMWADGQCSLTGEPVEGVYYAVRSDRPFTGSGSLQDLKAACRTGLDAKVTRILSGLRKVPLDVLVAAGIKVEHCHRGMGYGTSSERQAGKVAEEGVAEGRAKLREEILKRVGGDIAAAKQLCRDITKADKPGADGKTFPGFDTTDRITQGWQLEAAWKRLKAHGTFGDRGQGQNGGGGREPGVEG
jgi:hypothetical protein